MIKKHGITITASVISCIVGILVMYTFMETRVKAGSLLEITVVDHTQKFSKNDEKWEKQAEIDQAQNERLEGTERMQISLQKDQSALLAGQHQIREQQMKDLEFKVDIVKELGRLSGHIESITEVTETR